MENVGGTIKKKKKKNSLSAKSFYGNEPFHFRSHIVRARSHFFSSLLEQISWHVGDRRLKRECCARPVIGISKFPIKIRIVYRALCCDARVPRSRGSCCSNTRDTVRSRRNISDNQRKIATKRIASIANKLSLPCWLYRLRVQVQTIKKKRKRNVENIARFSLRVYIKLISHSLEDYDSWKFTL